MTSDATNRFDSLDREERDDPAAARQLFETSIVMAAAAMAADQNTQRGEDP